MYFRMDFPDTFLSRLGKSQNDQTAEEIMNKTCKFVDGRIQVGLLWDKDREIISATIPSDASETTARVRTIKMARRLAKTPHLKKIVEDSVEKLLAEGWAEIVDMKAPTSDIVWYLPGVLSERKGKHRFCLDGAAESHGVSLNSMLLTGEGSKTTIFTALQNARRYDFFAVSDIKSCFHQVLIPPEDRDALRFFRWIVGCEDILQCLRMKVNIFGSSCSESISSFALRRNAEVHGEDFSEEVVAAILGAYVDDVPTSSPTEESLIALVRGLIDLCSRGGFPLTKFVSNSRAVLDSVPEELRADGFKQRSGEIPRTSVLGVQYDPKEDTFRIKPSAKSVSSP